MTNTKFNDYYLREVGFEKEKEIELLEQKHNDLLHSPRRHNIIPVQQEYKIKIEKKMSEINEILAPTVSKLTKMEVINELREKLYIGLKPSFDQFNSCNYSAKDLHDNYKCSDNFLEQLNSNGISLAISLAKEY